MTMTTNTVTVPAGHEVHLVGRTNEPAVWRMPGGLLVATTGRGGDDQVAEIAALLDAIGAQVTRAPVVVVGAIAKIDELFAPARPATETLDSACAIYFQAGSLVGFTEAKLDRLAVQLRELGRRTTPIVCLDPAADVVRLRSRLAGMAARVASPDGTIAAEVVRPDGTIITGLVAQLAETIAAAPADDQAPLARSPMFTAMILAVVKRDTAETRRALSAALVARTAPFALLGTPGADGTYGIWPRDFGATKGVVAYPDVRSLHRAAHELGLQPGGYAIMAMPPATLMAWAASNELAVMACAFGARPDGTPGVWHVQLGAT
jgi:hypothetical protein